MAIWSEQCLRCGRLLRRPLEWNANFAVRDEESHSCFAGHTRGLHIYDVLRAQRWSTSSR